MTRLEALRALKEAGEAGKVSHAFFEELAIAAFGLGDSAINAGQAYGRQCLNAARALHEAVLPGWSATIQLEGLCYVHGFRGEHSALSNCPARAWLLAILAALIAQEEGI